MLKWIVQFLPGALPSAENPGWVKGHAAPFVHWPALKNTHTVSLFTGALYTGSAIVGCKKLQSILWQPVVDQKWHGLIAFLAASWCLNTHESP